MTSDIEIQALQDRVVRLERYIEVLHEALMFARNDYATHRVLADYSIETLRNAIGH